MRTDPPQDPPVFYVQVEGEELAGRQIQIGPDGLLVGRSAACDVVFDNRQISRRHCYLYLDGGRCYVKDLGSKNGLLVNGREAREERIDEGHVVDLGPSRLVVHADGGAAGAVDPTSQFRIAGVRPADLPMVGHPLAFCSVGFGLLAYLHWAFGVGAVLLALLSLWENRQRRDRLAVGLAAAGLALGIVGGVVSFSLPAPAPRSGPGRPPAAAIRGTSSFHSEGAGRAARAATRGAPQAQR
jgi:hypothetical protein